MRHKNKITGLEDCLTGLQWFALALGDKEEIGMLRTESGASFGVLTYTSTDRKQAAGVGFVESVDNAKPKKPIAAAAVAAAVKNDTLVAEMSGDQVWIVAVHGSGVVPGTDRFFSQVDAVEQISLLTEQYDFELAGSFALERIGDGAACKTFPELVSGVDPKKCEPVSLSGGMGHTGGIVKTLIIAVAISFGGWMIVEDAYLAPEREKVAALEAIESDISAARASLKRAKSGESPVQLYLKMDQLMARVGQPAMAGWRPTAIRCTSTGCDLSLTRAGNGVASIVELANLFNVPAKSLNLTGGGQSIQYHLPYLSDQKARENLENSRYWQDAGIIRKESARSLMVAERHTASLIDTLSLLKLQFGLSFSVGKSAPPGGVSYAGVPKSLTYRRGSWQISGDDYASSYAIHLIDEMGGYIDSLEIGFDDDSFMMKGYYLAK